MTNEAMLKVISQINSFAQTPYTSDKIEGICKDAMEQLKHDIKSSEEKKNGNTNTKASSAAAKRFANKSATEFDDTCTYQVSHNGKWLVYNNYGIICLNSRALDMYSVDEVEQNSKAVSSARRVEDKAKGLTRLFETLVAQPKDTNITVTKAGIDTTVKTITAKYAGEEHARLAEAYCQFFGATVLDLKSVQLIMAALGGNDFVIAIDSTNPLKAVKIIGQKNTNVAILMPVRPRNNIQKYEEIK